MLTFLSSGEFLPVFKLLTGACQLFSSESDPAGLRHSQAVKEQPEKWLPWNYDQ